jgi:hypothetical protein
VSPRGSADAPIACACHHTRTCAPAGRRAARTGAQRAEVLGRARHDVREQLELDAAQRRAIGSDIEEHGRVRHF